MSDRQAQGLKGNYMAIEVNITSRERIFINPTNGQRIKKIEKGIVDLADVRKFEGSGEERGDTQETEVNENL